MKKITYVAGQYSQFKLNDGTRLFIETLPEKVRIKKMVLCFIPTKILWDFSFPFYIRTVGRAWDLAKEILDLVLQSIEDCKTLNELKQRLHSETTSLLLDWVERNKERAYLKGMEELGSFAAKKYVKSSPMLRDAVAVSQDTMEIIGDYGKLLENLPTNEKESSRLLHPLSLLPHLKDKIDNAIKIALGIARDEETKNHLETALMALEDFIPDDEVPEKPEENMKAWLSRKDWGNPKAKELFGITLTKMFVKKYGENAEQKLEEFLQDLKKNNKH
ncbi:MAG: hypothetical protein AABY78_04285 [Nitrospirota bacterium]